MQGKSYYGVSDWNNVYGLNDSPSDDYVYDEDTGEYESIYREVYY